MITAEQLQEWRTLAEADAEYVVIAPASLAALLAEVEQLWAELDEQYYMLDKIDAYIDYAAETTPERWSFEEWVRLYREEEKYA